MKLIKWKYMGNYSCHEGLFVIEPKYLEWIKDKEIVADLGEIEGRWSEVEYEFSSEDFEIINCSDDFLKEFINLNCETGINPFLSYGEVKKTFEEFEDYISITIKEQLDKIYEENI